MKKKFVLLAGPCVIESEEMILKLAEKLKRIVEELPLDFYFKASFDKANRTSMESYRGPGLTEGLRILEKAKKDCGVRIVTDIHEPYQADIVKDVCDIIQIPAFLCRQTDLLVAAAKTGKAINVKKAQFLAPWDMQNVVHKIEKMDNKNIILCERGTSFGYNTLVVDMTSIVEMKKFGYPVIFDGTHSVQKPGGNGTSTSGNREYIPNLTRAAVAAGADGLFMETHENPQTALSDGANMINIRDLKELLLQCLELHEMITRD
ncbi:3-deoxy-8-phosphooctulonate synthase [bacterium D16-54]|nr:3-deoxy-8-phosphooctulonate synthase [bacterium D16-54]RKJ13283.1 3-deoxy-8-phosphooctulonate synthase [bacterium D16-56]